MTTSTPDQGAANSARTGGLEGRVARLLRVGTYLAIALIGVGVVLMLATGKSPLAVAPALEPGRLIADLAGLRPSAFLWFGIIVVLLTPASRVGISAVAYARAGDWPMALVAALILAVIAAGVILGTPDFLASIVGA